MVQAGAFTQAFCLPEFCALGMSLNAFWHFRQSYLECQECLVVKKSFPLSIEVWKHFKKNVERFLGAFYSTHLYPKFIWLLSAVIPFLVECLPPASLCFSDYCTERSLQSAWSRVSRSLSPRPWLRHVTAPAPCCPLLCSFDSALDG